MTAPAFKASPKLRRRLRRAIADEPHPAAGQQPRAAAAPQLAARVAERPGARRRRRAGGDRGRSGDRAERWRLEQPRRAGPGDRPRQRQSEDLRDRGELVVQHFTPPPSGKIYEVWLVRGKRAPQPTNALFDVNADGNGDVDVPGSLKGVDQVLVTPEPAGGSKVPTHTPVIAAQLS